MEYKPCRIVTTIKLKNQQSGMLVITLTIWCAYSGPARPSARASLKKVGPQWIVARPLEYIYTPLLCQPKISHFSHIIRSSLILLFSDGLETDYHAGGFWRRTLPAPLMVSSLNRSIQATYPRSTTRRRSVWHRRYARSFLHLHHIL